MKENTRIKTVNDLVLKLEGATSQEDYREIIKFLDIPINEWEPFLNWMENGYSRNCISRSKDYELLLLCWDAKEETSIHCHNSQECWVKVIQGDFVEKRYEFEDENEKLSLINKTNISDFQLSYMNDDMGYHSLENVCDHKAITLHLYVGPIDECTAFNTDSNNFEKVELSYDTSAVII